MRPPFLSTSRTSTLVSYCPRLTVLRSFSPHQTPSSLPLLLHPFLPVRPFLPLQEVKNLQWIATCLEHGVYSEVDRIIPIFSRVAKARV